MHGPGVPLLLGTFKEAPESEDCRCWCRCGWELLLLLLALVEEELLCIRW